MAEISATTAGVAIGAGIGITGTVMGAQIDALLLGLVAAIFMSFWLPSINDRLRAASAVAMASLLAGYGSPVAAAWLAGTQPGFSQNHELRLLVALIIGATTPGVVPFVIGKAQSLLGGRSA